jgi:hypothetical protein
MMRRNAPALRSLEKKESIIPSCLSTRSTIIYSFRLQQSTMADVQEHYQEGEEEGEDDFQIMAPLLVQKLAVSLPPTSRRLSDGLVMLTLYRKQASIPRISRSCQMRDIILSNPWPSPRRNSSASSRGSVKPRRIRSSQRVSSDLSTAVPLAWALLAGVMWLCQADG